MEEKRWTPSQEMAMSLSGKALLVSAAAGSGKTSVLTERIIRSLTDPDNPAYLSRMLVVTFTRAAAAELKGRIAEALTAALAKNPTDTRLSAQLLALSSAQISTIDSFFQRLVRANFEILGLSASFRVADENEIRPIAERIMEDLIEDYYVRYGQDTDPASPINQVRNNRFARALDHLMSNRSDGKLIEKLLEYPEQFASYPEGVGLLKRCADDLLNSIDIPFLETRYGEKLVSYLVPLLESFVNDLQGFHDGWAYNPDCVSKCDGLWSTDLAFCQSLLQALQSRDYERARLIAHSFVRGSFPGKVEKIDPVVRYQGWRNTFKEKIEGVQKKLQWQRDEITYQIRETSSLCEMLYEFFSEYQSRLLTEKQARGILEHNDIRAMVYRLLTKEDGSTSDFAKELAAKYDAVYIDEYQDVDLLQDRIFALIGGERRFMVGDIKQSIYGFRGSDPSIFAAYRRSMPLYNTPKAIDADGISVFMSENFRCNRPIIDFANQVCAFLFSACEDSVGYRPEDDLNCSKKEADAPPPPVKLAVFDAPPRGRNAILTDESEDGGEAHAMRAEARWVAAEISKLLRQEKKDNGTPFTPSDIAILVRTRSQAKPFMDALQRLNIPVSAESNEAFLRDPLLIDTVNLLRAIDNPFRDLPLSELLLSPIGGFSLEELAVLREASDKNSALFDAMRGADPEKIESSLRNKAISTATWLESLGKQAALLPADRFLRLLYLDERIIAYANEPVLLFLYEQARVYQRTSWCGLYGFLSHVEKLLEAEKISVQGFAKAGSAVTIMTIHHSKGLEFPAVFLGGCGGYFNRSDTYEKCIFHHTTGCASKLYNPLTGEHLGTALHEIVRQEMDLEQTEESIRTLYVALTRARERLFVSGTLRSLRQNALSAAAAIKRHNRAAILGCNSYLAWLLAAVKEPLTEKGVHYAEVMHFTQEEVDGGIPLRPSTMDTTPQPTKEIVDPLAAHYAEIRRRAASFHYPLDALHGLPTKVAASKLRADLLDRLDDTTQEDEALTEQIELMKNAASPFDDLLSDTEKPHPTDIGTATHAFLQFCDFARLANNGIDAECDRLVSDHFISENTAKIIHRKQLEAFCRSNLMELIQNATHVRREQKFGMLVPMSSLTQNDELAKKLGDTPLFIQGSIDLLLEMPDGSILLVDYKTDRIQREERENEALLLRRMRERHGEQLACYRAAVKQLFGKAPHRVLLYSLPLGKALEIDPLSNNVS